MDHRDSQDPREIRDFRDLLEHRGSPGHWVSQARQESGVSPAYLAFLALVGQSGYPAIGALTAHLDSQVSLL